MIDRILHAAEIRLRRLNDRRRTTIPASSLVVGVPCGGSDAFSGVTANPAVGACADLLVAPVSLLATANSGYAFSGWTGSAANAAAASTSITMSGPQMVAANFVALPILAGSITGKTGAYSAQVNTVALTNSGPGMANSARIDSFNLTQTAGAACKPVVRIALPVIVGNINPASSASGTVTVNYTGCSSASRLTVTFAVSANAGAVTGSKSLYNQTR